MTERLKAPFPYFGGKASIADRVWSALGRPSHYIEPFFGSGAVLLNRPNYQPQRDTETVCDADGHLANVWRAIKAEPEAVAEVCDWPVNHADLIARKARLNRETAGLLEKLCADEKYYHVELAGYWIWAASCWIGHGLICPTQRPHISVGGMGVHARGQRPHIGDGGTGVHAKRRPPLFDWFDRLAARLRYVRVVCGDWTRVCGGNWQDRIGVCGMFFDPPYGDKADRCKEVYAVDSLDVADDVRKWCLDRGDNPRYRIVLAGYYEEHESLLAHGWQVERWSAQGGYSSLARNGDSRGQRNRQREALFLSPHCAREPSLFAG